MFSLGLDYESSGFCCEALDYYRSTVKLFDSTRAILHSEDVWKISFCDLYRVAYNALWRTLLKNGEVVDALCAADQGRAQALMDILTKQYGIESLAFMSVEPKETISYIFNDLSTQTVFVALDENTINFSVLRKERKVHFKHREVENGISGLQLLKESTLKEIGAGVRVRCENRSMDEITDDPPSNRASGDENV